MVALNGFDANQVAPSAPMESLPEGKYEVMIVASKDVPTKAGTGSFIELEMDVISGPHTGRKAWDRLNINNPNQTAVDIAYKTLSAICHAVGVMTPRDTQDLHNKPMILTRKAKRDKKTGDVSVECAGYEPRGGSQPAALAPQPPQTYQPPAQQAQPSVGAAPPPWRR